MDSKTTNKKVIKRTKKIPLKGGDDSTSRNDTDERRAMIESSVRARVALERTTFEYQAKLIGDESNEIITPDRLLEYGAYFQPQHYEDVLTERGLANKCGFPLCDNRLPKSSSSSKRYQISISEKKVYDLQQMKNFCSEQCFITSTLFSSQLSDTPIYLRDLKKEVDRLKLIPILPINTADTSKSSSSSSSNSSSLPHLMENLTVKERDTTDLTPPTPPSSSSSSSSSRSIEGFDVPIKPTGSGTNSKSKSKQKALVKPTLSSFGIIWTLLESWCTPRTIEYLFGSDGGDIAHENSKEPGDDLVDQVVPKLNPRGTDELRKDVLLQGIATYAQDLLAEMGVAVSIDRELARLVSTFSTEKKIASLTANIWRTIAMVFLRLLCFRNEYLEKAMIDTRASSVAVVMTKYRIRNDEMKVFIELFTQQRKVSQK